MLISLHYCYYSLITDILLSLHYSYYTLIFYYYTAILALGLVLVFDLPTLTVISLLAPSVNMADESQPARSAEEG